VTKPVAVQLGRTGRVRPLPLPHEWLSFDDPHERRHWLFDVTFLLSNWTCIFGRGCPGVLTGPAPELVQGCCSYGAHFVDEDDVAVVEAAAATMSEDEWQFARKGRKNGTVKRAKNGEIVTRLVDGACVFLNRPGFPAGPGCSLHQVALKRGLRPLDLKPTVCWQLPLRREDTNDDDGWVTSRVIEWDRRHWGAGGFEFDWWCTDSHEAFVGEVPVYDSMRDELVELVGQEIYDMAAAYLDQRRANGEPALVHPALTQPGGQLEQA
jgi:hypothetical protein